MNKLKKFLLASALSSVALSSIVVSGNALAQEESENKMYISLAGGIAMPNKQSITWDDGEKDFARYKPKIGFMGIFEVGYYAEERVRLGLALIKSVTKGEQKTKKYDIDPNDATSYSTFKGTMKYDINALQFKVYYDAVEFGAKSHLYIGAGAGASRVKVKDNATAQDVVAGVAQDIERINSKTKTKTNFCGSLALGVKFEVADGVDLGAEYNFSTFGKAKAKKTADDPGWSTKNIMMHSVVAKLAFKF